MRAVLKNLGYAMLAVLCSLAIFAGLPLLERLSAKEKEALPEYVLREIQRAPPPPAPPEQKPIETTIRSNTPRPQPKPPREQLQVQPQLRLSLEMSRIAGDFAVDFDVAQPDLKDRQQYIFELGEIDSPPQAVVRFPPNYPPRARIRKEEGFVVVEFVVNTDGKVSEAKIFDAEPAGLFDQAALQAIQQWRFRPGSKDGEAVPVRVRQKLQFSLGSG